MSEIRDKVIEQTMKDMDKEIEMDRKKAIIEENRVNAQVSRIEQQQKELELIKKTSFGALSDEEIAKIIKDNDEYIEGARAPILFINEVFRNIVPFFRKNLILIGGKTGEGKSTTVANIVSTTMAQTNPKTKKRRRVLVITNEEKREDVYNRITCLAKNWAYTNHDKFTDEMVLAFRYYTPILAKDGWLTVIDDSHGGGSGVTTTIEGIQTIFENLIRDEEWYDVIIIDYYQNIKSSKNDHMMNEYEVQAKLAAMLDKYKNVYPAPIVIMAQVQPPSEDNKPFEYRIKGRKIITDPATLIMEMVAEREHLRTKWIVHKSRFTGSVGKEEFTGFDKGRFVPYDNAFKAEVLRIKEKESSQSWNKNSAAKMDELTKDKKDE